VTAARQNPAPEFDILGFGAVAVDDLLYVDEYPPADSKVRVRHRRRQCGGLTGNALVAAARLGAGCAYVGVLGEDELSQVVARSLASEGIDLTYSSGRPDARPAHSTIIVDESRKTRTIFSSLEGPIGADPTWPEPELVRSSAVLLVDHHGLEGTLRAVRIARAGDVSVVADFERDPGPPFAELLGLVDHLIISERFARELTGLDEAAAAAVKLWQPGRQAVVVTCGARGCWYLPGPDEKTPRHCPAFAVKAIDTTGCGDVFHGAYAAVLARGENLPNRVRVASAVASLTASHSGGPARIPTRQGVETFLAEQDPG